ncbi:MAG: DUF2975 domain-containing protein [Clostridium sp.]|uniref:DUF2975 domain-containing protein n=1 Tax=Clostridium sp. TaxID=1506 RepID=UPI00290FF0E1|nr:DUF2975 domain-containing protein [Clostridium sp.]MDU5110377.1 DUF2975 domain-containing protein [Clostridium sp.]
MKKRSTLFLKIALFFIGSPIVALCIVGLPWITKETMGQYPWIDYLKYPILIGLYGTAIAFFAILYQAFKLLTYIDKGDAFSKLSVKALKNIKYSAVSISTIYVLLSPLLYIIAEMDDAPGIILIVLVFIFASAVISVFAALLQKLLQEAIDIKSENDLTI